MGNWIYWIIGLSAALLIFLLWQEFKRPNIARLLWRILSTIVAVISLACIALPLKYKRNISTNTTHQAILLTEGFSADSLDAFKRNAATIPVYTIDEKLLTARKFNATYIADPATLIGNKFNAVHVFGYGLNATEMESLGTQPIVFHPTNIPNGLTAINWNQRLKTSERLYVQGRYNNTSGKPVELRLISYNATLDSVTIGANKNQLINLTTIPKQVGRNVFELNAISNRDTIHREPIPIIVTEGIPLKVLMLSSSPNFETKFLKNWLAQKGYEVNVRVRTSKNKFTQEFLNSNNTSIKGISIAIVDKFDIFIADNSELSSISKQELGALQASIAQKGKGLIVIADSTNAANSFYSSKFPLVKSKASNQQQLAINLSDSTTKLKTLSIENPLFIRPTNSTQPLAKDKQSRLLVNSTLYGSGKIVLNTLSNTFSWALAGNQNDYELFWTELLDKVSPQVIEDETWTTAPFIPRVNTPVTISLQTNSTTIPQGQIENVTVPLKNNYKLPFIWSGSYWPIKPGWQKLVQLNGDIDYWYAYDPNDWSGVYSAEKIELTKEYEQLHKPRSQQANSPVNEEQNVPKIIFYLLFLICCSYLWFENKYYNS